MIQPRTCFIHMHTHTHERLVCTRIHARGEHEQRACAPTPYAHPRRPQSSLGRMRFVPTEAPRPLGTAADGSAALAPADDASTRSSAPSTWSSPLCTAEHTPHAQRLLAIRFTETATRTNLAPHSAAQSVEQSVHIARLTQHARIEICARANVSLPRVPRAQPHTDTHTRQHTYPPKDTDIHTDTDTQTGRHGRTRARTDTDTDTDTHTNTHIHIHIHTHTNTHTHTHTHTHTKQLVCDVHEYCRVTRVHYMLHLPQSADVTNKCHFPAHSAP
jgi:hypothetical protein